MADVAKVALVVNAGTAVTTVDGAASQTIVFDKDAKIILRVSNAGATTARLKFAVSDVGLSKGQGVLNVDVAQNAIKYVMLESARFKAFTGKVTFQILDTDDSSFGGTVADVDLEVIQLPA